MFVKFPLGLKTKPNFLDVDYEAIVESKSRCSEIANNSQEEFKTKRKRTNSIFQLEKHTDKIVKGWNQMINDLTPKISNVYAINEQYTDKTSNQDEANQKAMEDNSNIGRRKNNVLSLPAIDISHIEFRFNVKALSHMIFIFK